MAIIQKYVSITFRKFSQNRSDERCIIFVSEFGIITVLFCSKSTISEKKPNKNSKDTFEKCTQVI